MSTFELRAVDRNKIYTSIVEQLVDGIRTGAFPPGAALPPERILAQRLGVSRTSVREAIRVLEHAGVLDVRTGSGTYVTEGSLSSPVLLRMRAVLEGDQSPLDLLVARKALEPVCAEAAATNRTAHDLEALSNILDEQKSIVSAGGDPREIDVTFHLAVAEASHNAVLLLLMRELVTIMRQGTWQEFTNRSRARHGRTQRNLEDHRAILGHIEASNPQGAREAILNHLSDVEQTVLGQVPEETLV